MIDPDSLQSSQIQRKLRSKEFILVNYSKATHELWVNDISLVGVLDEDGKEHILDGWTVCKYCLVPYRTHSKRDSSQTRKNFGLISFHAHVKQCRPYSSSITFSTSKRTDGVPKESALVQALKPRFTYNKNQLSQQLQRNLKDAELKSIIAGSHSFNVLENDAVLDLKQTAIDSSAQLDRISVRDVIYGRKTIRTETMAKFRHFSTTIRQVIDEPIKNHRVAATFDI